jgi:hypothetical protein
MKTLATSEARALFLTILATFLLGGCAANRPASADKADEATVEDDSVEAPVDTDSKQGALTDECESLEGLQEQDAQPRCDETKKSDEALLDRTQRVVYGVMENTTRWFDGFFGTSQLSEGEHVSRGAVRVSGLWDQRDGLDSRFNLRARFALPALQDRTRLILGRGDTEDIIDGTTNEAVDSLPGSFDQNRDDDWLIGLGFNRSGDMSRGLDFGIGIRLASPPEPYVNATYRWYKTWDNSWSFRARPRAFLQYQRGAGVTLDSDLNYATSSTLMLRWANSLAVEDRVEGLGWRSDLIAYQGLTNNRAFAYGVFAQGETAAEVELQNAGFEIIYRQRVAREWFYIELATGVSWPREFLIEQRESNIGAGITFEMRFGRW